MSHSSVRPSIHCDATANVIYCGGGGINGGDGSERQPVCELRTAEAASAIIGRNSESESENAAAEAVKVKHKQQPDLRGREVEEPASKTHLSLDPHRMPLQNYIYLDGFYSKDVTDSDAISKKQIRDTPDAISKKQMRIKCFTFKT